MLSLKTLRASGMTALLLAATATTALAADMIGAPPPPPVPVAAPILGGDSGFYLRGDIGYGTNRYSKLSTWPAATGTTVTTGDSLRGTFSSDVGFGYAWNSWLRTDATFEYRSAAGLKFTETLTPGPFVNNDRAKLSAVVALANAYVDLGTWNKITPFVGVGIGVRSASFSGVRDYCPSGPCIGSDGYAERSWHTGLAWALHAGVGYDITSNLKAEIGYRYLNMGAANANHMRCRAGSAVVPNPNLYQDCAGGSYRLRATGLGSHDIRFGLRYMFADAAPAPMYAPGPLVRKY